LNQASIALRLEHALEVLEYEDLDFMSALAFAEQVHGLVGAPAAGWTCALGTRYSSAMKPVLLFVAACAAIFLVGWVVSKRTGSHAWFIEDWKYNEGEVVLWRDDAADVGMIGKLAQAAVQRPLRYHRWAVVVTSERILIGNKTLTGKQMVKCVLYPGKAPGEDSQHLGGGLLTTGYETLVIEPVAASHTDGKYPYVALKPAPETPSSFNLAEVRIYTDKFASFRLPQAAAASSERGTQDR